MRILTNVNNSVLILYVDDWITKKNFLNHASASNIDSKRIIFAERLNRNEYFARFKIADLFLDTYPYNAGTTASDALWSGLPVLTLQGKSFASRIASSLLTAIGLPELIATSIEDYELLAIELGHNFQKISHLKSKLLKNKSSSELFNTNIFTRKIEGIFKKLLSLHP
jgi:predicted O-linked N-acetylglucosamine transferase (SPINDLY family)